MPRSHRDARFPPRLAQDATRNKIMRDAFLYIEPKSSTTEFAQCRTCRSFIPDAERCVILGPAVRVTAGMSCGYYLQGQPRLGLDAALKPLVTPKEAGLVEREVRCENCVSYNAGRCTLYERLNATFPDQWDLDPRVAARGCCNAQMPR